MEYRDDERAVDAAKTGRRCFCGALDAVDAVMERIIRSRQHPDAFDLRRHCRLCLVPRDALAVPPQGPLVAGPGCRGSERGTLIACRGAMAPAAIALQSLFFLSLFLFLSFLFLCFFSFLCRRSSSSKLPLLMSAFSKILRASRCCAASAS